MRVTLRRSLVVVASGSILLFALSVVAQPRAAAAPAAPARAAAAAAPAVPAVAGGAQSEADLTEQDKQMLAWCREGVAKITAVMERWVRGNKINQKKLFSFFYFPIPNTDPQKFHTDYDQWSDQEIGPIQEAIYARAPEMRFVVTVDKNGYLPTHNARYSQPLTGHAQIDLVNNRTKRIFNDRTGYRAARNTNPFFIQVYQRDTGEIMKDLSVPIFLFGKHWGGLRIGYVAK